MIDEKEATAAIPELGEMRELALRILELAIIAQPKLDLAYGTMPGLTPEMAQTNAALGMMVVAARDRFSPEDSFNGLMATVAVTIAGVVHEAGQDFHDVLGVLHTNLHVMTDLGAGLVSPATACAGSA
jgi:hypothetical protein